MPDRTRCQTLKSAAFVVAIISLGLAGFMLWAGGQSLASGRPRPTLVFPFLPPLEDLI